MNDRPGRHSRRNDPYRVALRADPDLPRHEDPDWPGCFIQTDTEAALDAAWQSLVQPAGRDARGRPIVVLPTVKTRLKIMCEPHGCGSSAAGRRSARQLAGVYRTDEGLLFVSEYLTPRAKWKTLELRAEWQQARSERVRDLLDRDELDHVPLRVKCNRRPGAAILDRSRVLAAIPPRGSPGLTVPISSLVLLVESSTFD